MHGPDTFLYEAGAKDAPCRVRFLVPHGGRIATGLDQRGGGADPAHDYNILVDAPTEMGSLEMTDSEMDSAAA